MSDWATRLRQAHDNDRPYPNFTADHADATIASAYAAQTEFVASLDGRIIGYKAALTAAPAQAAMGIDAPVSGVLFDWGARAANTTITSPRQLLLETELGYRLAERVSGPVTADSVLGKIATCHPMIEIASPNLASRPSGVDLIAANSASFGYIEGQGIAVGDLALDQIEASLRCNGAVLHDASSGSVMSGQANALAWLVNQILSIRGELDAGMLLMSGAIGPPHPGKPGSYRGEFGPLGVIEFELG